MDEKITKMKEFSIEIEIFERKQQQTYSPRNKANQNYQIEMFEKKQVNQIKTHGTRLIKHRKEQIEERLRNGGQG